MFDVMSSNPMLRVADKAMGLATKRLELVASNMANIDTPGYHTQDFDFKTALKQALGDSSGDTLSMARTHPMHLPSQGSQSLPPMSDELRPQYERNDGNDVSLDRESLMLAKAQSAYTMGSNFAQQELRKIRQMIRDLRA